MSNKFVVEIDIGAKDDYYCDDTKVTVYNYHGSNYSNYLHKIPGSTVSYIVKCFKYNGRKTNVYSPLINVKYVSVYYASDTKEPLLVELYSFSNKYLRHMSYYYTGYSQDNWNGYVFRDADPFREGDLPVIINFLKNDKYGELHKLQLSSGKISRVKYEGDTFIKEDKIMESTGESYSKPATPKHKEGHEHGPTSVVFVSIFFSLLIIALIGIVVIRYKHNGPLFLGYRSFS